MRRPVIMAVSLGLLAVVLLIGAAVAYFERPTTLRVAVSPSDAADFDIVNAAAKLLKRRHIGLHFQIISTAGVKAAAAALDDGSADLAVVRADVAMPANGETVVLTHKDAALLVAPAGGVDAVEDLAGKRVGMLSSRPGDAHLLDAALAQVDIAPDAVTAVPLTAAGLAEAIRSHSVDAVFAVGPTSNGLVPDTVRTVARAGGGAPVFIPVAEADAVVQRAAAYESVEIVRGAFGGTPPRPAEEFDTLGVTYRLVASTELSENTVAALTRFLLSDREALAQMAPAARRIEAPSTDKGAALPAHPGTAAYIDDEESSFFDSYSDYIYIGAMGLGVLASGMTAILGRFSISGTERVEDLVARLLDVFKRVRTAPSAAALDELDGHVDEVITHALDQRSLRNLDERRAAALNLAVEQVRSAIRDRRKVLRDRDAADRARAGSALPAPEA